MFNYTKLKKSVLAPPACVGSLHLPRAGIACIAGVHRALRRPVLLDAQPVTSLVNKKWLMGIFASQRVVSAGSDLPRGKIGLL
jgi:hypothetical protein